MRVRPIVGVGFAMALLVSGAEAADIAGPAVYARRRSR